MKRTVLLVFLVPGLLLGDEVFLKGGGKFSGRITAQDEERITIDLGYGSIGFSMERVERIVKGPSPIDEYDSRAGKLGPQDVDGWRSLGLWASQKGLSIQSRAAFEKVLALAPDDAAARRALGFVSLDGRWVTEEESYRARGYVQYDGEWMTPAEAQLAQADAAAEQAKKEADRRAIEAEVAAVRAEQREDAERKRAEDEARARERSLGYWGGWGYGVTTWPSGGVVVNNAPPVNAAQLPGGGR